HGVEAEIKNAPIKGFICDECDDAVGGCAAEYEIGRLIEYFLEVKDGAQRFAHLIEQFENLGLSAKVVQLLRRGDTGIDRKMGLPAADLVCGDQQLSLAERFVIIIDRRRSLRYRGLSRRGRRCTRYRVRNGGGNCSDGLDRRSGEVFDKLELAFADDDRVATQEPLLKHRRAVHENMIDAADKLAVLEISVNDHESAVIPGDARVLSRDTTIVEDDVVILCAADGKGLVRFKPDLPTLAVRLCDL